MDASGVDARDGSGLCEKSEQFPVDPGLFPFDIDRVDQKFRTEFGEERHGFRRDLPPGEFLPAIGDDPVAPLPRSPAGKVEDEALSAGGGDQLFEVITLPRFRR